MQLNGIKRPHLHIIQFSIAVNIHTGEPIADRNFIRLVFFGKHEKDEIFIRQMFLTVLRFAKGPRCRVKDAIDNHVREGMVAILEQVISGNPIVAIMIKFPEATIQDIEMFIAEVSRHLVNVFLVIHLHKGIQQIAPPDLSKSNLARMTLVDSIKDPRNHRDGILFLELRMVGQKLEALYYAHSIEYGACRVGCEKIAYAGTVYWVLSTGLRVQSKAAKHPTEKQPTSNILTG